MLTAPSSDAITWTGMDQIPQTNGTGLFPTSWDTKRETTVGVGCRYRYVDRNVARYASVKRQTGRLRKNPLRASIFAKSARQAGLAMRG